MPQTSAVQPALVCVPQQQQICQPQTVQQLVPVFATQQVSFHFVKRKNEHFMKKIFYFKKSLGTMNELFIDDFYSDKKSIRKRFIVAVIHSKLSCEKANRSPFRMRQSRII